MKIIELQDLEIRQLAPTITFYIQKGVLTSREKEFFQTHFRAFFMKRAKIFLNNGEELNCRAVSVDVETATPKTACKYGEKLAIHIQEDVFVEYDYNDEKKVFFVKY